jgi:hypothetical protein
LFDPLWIKHLRERDILPWLGDERKGVPHNADPLNACPENEIHPENLGRVLDISEHPCYTRIIGMSSLMGGAFRDHDMSLQIPLKRPFCANRTHHSSLRRSSKGGRGSASIVLLIVTSITSMIPHD